MGNSSTKEARLPQPHLHHPGSGNHRGHQPPSPTSLSSPSHPSDRHASPLYHSRRGDNRADLSLLGIRTSSQARESSSQDAVRKETKQEREARRVERERVARLKERERSMREESVDGGYLVTQGVYTGIEDFSKSAVRQLMVERRIAPFFRGLNDHSEAWRDHQIIATARGSPLPAADDVTSEAAPWHGVQYPELKPLEAQQTGLTIPSATRPQAQRLDLPFPSSASPQGLNLSLPGPTSPIGSSTSSSAPPFRPRSKTVATLTTLSRHPHHGEISPSEIHLPVDPYVEGRPLEVALYKETSECPICFLYYPPYLNKTRCCDQPICSECFVQIKRPDPHPPEHTDPSAAPALATGTTSTGEGRPETDGALVSEPAGCPFCVQPEFGITYEPPSFRRGLVYANQAEGGPALIRTTSAMSSDSSLSSSSVPTNGLLPSPTFHGRRRTTSLSVNDTSVITTDKIRPDWAQKLASAKAQQARRSAAATALHAAAYLMNSSDAPGFRGFRRRSRSRHPQIAGESSSNDNGLVSLSSLGGSGERPRRPSAAGQGDSSRQGNSENDSDAPGQSARRARIEDLEEMMMMEAIRLSLVSEDDRRKKEGKEAKKDAKNKEKDRKRAEKAARRGLHSGGSTDSVHSVGGSTGVARPVSSGDATVPGKGKNVDRSGNSPLPSAPLSPSGPSSPAVPMGRVASNGLDRTLLQSPDVMQQSSSHPGSDVYRPSHLRQVSNTSSTASSFIESAPGSMKNNNDILPGSNSSLEASASAGQGDEPNKPSTLPEPTHSFQSLAAMIGRDDRWNEGLRAEHHDQAADGKGHARDRSVDSTPCTAHA